MCGMKIAKKRCNSSSTTKLNTLWYVGFQPFSFLRYYFLEFDYFIFYFQKTYNNQLKERYRDNLSTHPDFAPDLWMEAGSSGGLNRNQV